MSGIVLTNGKIYTLDENFPKAHTVIIEKNRISKVSDKLEQNKGVKSLYIDLKGKTAIPAFCDSHFHLLLYAQSLNQIDFNPAGSLEGALNLVKARIKKNKPKKWILGKRLDINRWPNPKFPDKKSLDKISPKNPVAISSRDEHTLWVNSMALKMAGIDENFPDPVGGKIERYPNSNEPTGILREQATSLVNKIWSSPTSKEFEKLFDEVVQNCYKLGITSVHNFDGAKTHYFLKEMSERGKLSLRILEFFKDYKLDELIDSKIYSGMEDEYLKIGGIKLFADGALGSGTALVFEPYEGTEDNFGIEVTNIDKLKSQAAKANANGLNVAIHAIGDKGVHNALDAIEYSVHKNKKICKNRIEHAQLVRSSGLKRFSGLGITASVQPVHVVYDKDMAIKKWGKRCSNSYLLNSFLENKVRTILGSDCPIEDLDPLKGIYAAVTRKCKDNEKPFYPEERIDIKEAVLGFTKWPAIYSGEEGIKGSIGVGELADMIVLSDDIFEVSPREIPNIEVLATIFDGKIVYGEENL